ncbi:hypothetical protein DITRI_Ditri04bG0166300 [Diplodiscus trichospermus]
MFFSYILFTKIRSLFFSTEELYGTKTSKKQVQKVEQKSELVSSPVASPSKADDEALVTAAGEGENPLDVVNDENNDEGDASEEIVPEGFDKTSDGNDKTAVDTDQMPETAVTGSETTSTSAPPDAKVSKQIGGSSPAPEVKDVKQTSPVSATSTLVNLQERKSELEKELC